MQPKHVKEAFRLLNKSIIRVETPDVNLEQDDELEEEEQQQQEEGKSNYCVAHQSSICLLHVSTLILSLKFDPGPFLPVIHYRLFTVLCLQGTPSRMGLMAMLMD